MSNDLLKESIINSKKLKLVAEENAKKQILESITPQIKKMIQSKFNSKGFLFENEEVEVEEDDFSEEDDSESYFVSGDALAAEPVEVPDQNLVTPAPLEPVDSDVLVTDLQVTDDQVNVTLPDEDGKIVVDFEDLFELVPSEEESPAVVSVPKSSPDVSVVAEPTPEGMLDEPSVEFDETDEESSTTTPDSEEDFKEEYEELLERLLKKVNVSLKENNTALKQNLERDFFVLLEKLDSLQEKGLISLKEKEKNENKLNFLYTNLNKRVNENIYKNKKEATNMKTQKTLKRFAKRLFENDDHSVHATKTSNELSHDLDDLDLELVLEEDFNEPELDTPWDEAEHHVLKDDQDEELLLVDDEVEGAEGHVLAGFGDDEDALVEIDEEELLEALNALKEYKKEEKLKKEMKYSHHALDEDLEFSVKVDVPEEVEDALEGLDSDDFEVEISLEDDFDDEVLDLVDDEDCEDCEDHDDSDEMVEFDLEDEDFSDEMVDMEEPVDFPEEEPLMEKKMKLKEARLRRLRARKLHEARARTLAAARKSQTKPISREVVNLKKQLNETNLFTAKAVYLNKFLMREGLSKKVVRQIVEHLDRAQTLAEAKSIYTKIDEKLKRSAPQTKLAGSASKATRSGAANRLQENVSLNGNKQLIDVDRWQKLAGIKK